jgi:hypothetical protein
MINRELWLLPFQEDNIPTWPCPQCNKGVLKPFDNGFRRWEGNEVEPTDSDDEDVFFEESQNTRLRYNIFLECDNKFCHEHFVSCGYGRIANNYIGEFQEFKLLTDSGGSICPEIFFPEYFSPPLVLFPISKKCPKKVEMEIKSSFKLFFADPPASANYIRKAVDEILTDKKISRFITSKKGKKRKLSLHERIVKFETTQPDVAKKLFAIKWLGNEGSHADTISKNDVLDGYEILESVLDDLYEGYQKKLINKVSKINKAKMPLHPTT